MTLGSTSNKETVVTEIKIKAFEAMVSKSNDGVDFASFALRVMSCRFSSTESM